MLRCAMSLQLEAATPAAQRQHHHHHHQPTGRAGLLMAVQRQHKQFGQQVTDRTGRPDGSQAAAAFAVSCLELGQRLCGLQQQADMCLLDPVHQTPAAAVPRAPRLPCLPAYLHVYAGAHQHRHVL